MHTAYKPGSGDISIVIGEGVVGHLQHEGAPVTVFGYQGSHLRYTGDPTTGGPQASCEQWMVDIQGTTVHHHALREAWRARRRDRGGPRDHRVDPCRAERL